MNADTTYTVAALARRYGVSVDTVRRWIAARELRAVCVSADPRSRRPRYVVRQLDLDAFEAKRSGCGRTPRRRGGRGRFEVPPGTIRFVGGY